MPTGRKDPFRTSQSGYGTSVIRKGSKFDEEAAGKKKGYDAEFRAIEEKAGTKRTAGYNRGIEASSQGLADVSVSDRLKREDERSKYAKGK